MTRGRITAVIGAQYGSEGKGAVVAHIANQYGAHVRVGSPNAGHTIYWRGKNTSCSPSHVGGPTPTRVLL